MRIIRALASFPVVCTLGLLPASLLAQDDASVLTVAATAEVQREPDQATITFGVETMEETVAEAIEQNATRMEAVFEALRGLGIPEGRMHTSSFGVRPVHAPQNSFDPAEGSRRITGHTATNSVEVRLNSIEDVGETIETAIRAGANRVRGLSFGLSNPEEARHAALEQAITKARGEAEAMVGAIDGSLGRVLDIRNEATPSAPRPVRTLREFSLSDDMSAEVSTPIEPGAVDVSATVTVVYLIDPEELQEDP